MPIFLDDSIDPKVSGFLHSPERPACDGIILTHGAGGNCNAPLLVAVSELLAEIGFTVLRCDLPFRQQRPTGPPFPTQAERDRAGLRNAVEVLRKRISGRIFLGGHSYGGRQATMLCAEHSHLVAALLLLSYPLHPPGKPEQLRIQHLPNLLTPALFIHGSHDPLGSPEEVTGALRLIPANHRLVEVEGAGHDLGFKGKKRTNELPGRIVDSFREFIAQLD